MPRWKRVFGKGTPPAVINRSIDRPPRPHLSFSFYPDCDSLCSFLAKDRLLGGFGEEFSENNYKKLKTKANGQLSKAPHPEDCASQ
jgi:hypothetical protein